MMHVLLWVLVISLAGWLTFPLAYRLFPNLPDRGFAFARTLGVLLWGYLFWLLASLFAVPNNLGGILLALLVLLAASAVALRGNTAGEIRGWLRSHARWVISVEVIFLLAFSAMALVRAANPEILGTEKPMELAFINAILHSPSFPPHDPWLSGYAISYYYFGYVIVAMLAKLTATSGGVAFNLGICLAFSLSAVGVYGILYNLLRLIGNAGERLSEARLRWLSLLGPVFLLLVSNVEGFLHVLHTRGLFWVASASGQLTSSFWTWLDILDLNQPPSQPFSWIPTRFWWWWRASRVVRDYDFSGAPREIINEFPVFSYLLSDLHPHVLAMPFAFLAMALALQLFLSKDSPQLSWLRWKLSYRSQAWIALLLIPAGLVCLWVGLSGLSLRLAGLGLVCLVAAGVIYIRIPADARRSGGKLWLDSELGAGELGLRFRIDNASYWLSALVLGGLAFLNTWDFPIYLALFAAVYALQTGLPGRRSLSSLLADFFTALLALGGASIALYLPFYLGFASQAGGLIPNLVYPTRGAQLWVMFAPLLLPVLVYLLYLWRSDGTAYQLKRGLSLSAGLILVLWAASWLFAFFILLLPGVRELFLGSLAATGSAELFLESLVRRFTSPGGWTTVLVLFGLGLGLLLPSHRQDSQPPARAGLASPHRYGMLLLLLGTLLVMGAEFFFLRDQFGYRINTIFKFYYQAWLMWSVVAALGSAVLLIQLPRGWGIAFRLALALVLLVGLTYTALGLASKTSSFQPPSGWSLDGTDYYARQAPDDMAAIQWLSKAPSGVVAEAVGGSYTEYARVATFSGQPTVLGWPGHESQWRGGAQEMGSRQEDLRRLYCTREADEMLSILQQYNIRYVYVGSLERATYTPDGAACASGLSEDKFAQHLLPVYQSGGVTIYESPPQHR